MRDPKGAKRFRERFGRVRLSSLREARNDGMRARIWECVDAGR